jgi:hypothetical protein
LTARPSLLARLRQRAAAPPARPAVPPPGVLRRERRALLKLREERLRDLGGLLLEMYRRDRFSEDLVRERCSELLEIDARLGEIESMVAVSRRRAPAARCTCGAPILWGSHFCQHCGRPTGSAVVACTGCAHALPADATFCPNCGTTAPAIEGEPPAEQLSDGKPAKSGSV